MDDACRNIDVESAEFVDFAMPQRLAAMLGWLPARVFFRGKIRVAAGGLQRS